MRLSYPIIICIFVLIDCEIGWTKLFSSPPSSPKVPPSPPKSSSPKSSPPTSSPPTSSPPLTPRKPREAPPSSGIGGRSGGNDRGGGGDNSPGNSFKGGDPNSGRGRKGGVGGTSGTRSLGYPPPNGYKSSWEYFYRFFVWYTIFYMLTYDHGHRHRDYNSQRIPINRPEEPIIFYKP